MCVHYGASVILNNKNKTLIHNYFTFKESRKSYFQLFSEWQKNTGQTIIVEVYSNQLLLKGKIFVYYFFITFHYTQKSKNYKNSRGVVFTHKIYFMFPGLPTLLRTYVTEIHGKWLTVSTETIKSPILLWWKNQFLCDWK